MLKEKVNKIVEVLKGYYLNDNRPFAVGYSGGKDSTVTLDLVFKMLLEVENPKKTVFVQFSDTLMEMDPVISGINDSFNNMKKFIDEHKLPVVIKRVEPVPEESFFTLLIGKGYQLPDTQNRWCTDRLKLRPQNRNIQFLKENFNGVISVTGVRHAESADRSARLKKITLDGMYKTHDIPGWNTLTPIEWFSADDVWSYIYTEALEWVDSTTLGRQYAEAAGDGGECRTLLEGLEGEQAGCSKSARYGCWICPLFKKDKTLNNLSEHYGYMTKMEKFRNWLVAFKEEGWSKARRIYKNSRQAKSIYNKNNHRKGMVVPSGYTLEWRKMVLEKLWALEQEISEFREEPLITDEELRLIQKLWFEEGDLDLTAEKITGKKLFDENMSEERAFGLYVKYTLFVEPEEGSINWFPAYYNRIPFIPINISERFCTQLAIELLERYSLDQAADIFFAALKDEYFDKERAEAHRKIYELPVCKMYHPSDFEEKYIRKEWAEDRIGFVRFLDLYEKGEIEKPAANLFGYDGDYGIHFEQLDELEEKGDICDCESISLEDKMAFFENW